MSIESTYPHSNLDELIMAKIPALSKRGAENNKVVLKNIALNGISLKYDVSKRLDKDHPLKYYGTVSRRIDSLKKGGYLAEAGKRPTERGKQTEQSLYGLTWKGFIASLSIEDVRGNVLQILEKNPLLDLPAKELVLIVLKNNYDPKELEEIGTFLIRDFLTTAPSLKDIDEGELKFRLLISMIGTASPILDQIMQKENVLELLNDPEILRFIKEIIPTIKANFESQIRNLLFSVKVLDAINSIKPEEKPSEKLKEFFSNLKEE